jgi:hypothetical protein
MHLPLHSFPETHVPLQGASLATHWLVPHLRPFGHSMSHFPFVQTARPFDGAEQGEHDPPHVATSLLDLQSAPHLWNPELHFESQDWPLLHVGVALGTSLQRSQAEAPHESTLLLSLHSIPH